MRPVREISAEEEDFRIVPVAGIPGAVTIKRDPVEPEPVGTLVVMAFRVVGYNQDCDGSLMARLEHVDRDGESSGWMPTNIGLYPESDLVVTPEEWRAMFPVDDALSGGESAAKGER